MSVSGRKGLVGENGVTNYLNSWFPLHEQGIGAKRIRSKGVKDIGDVDGVPYTCIEVKNHSNPPVSQLLDNAEWKANNSGRPVWFLVYKRDGYGEARASRWHTMITAAGFLSGMQPTTDGQPSFTVDQIEELCDQHSDILAEIGAAFPGMVEPDHKWRLRIMFRPHIQSVQSQRDMDMEQYIYDLHGREELFTEDVRELPVIITPRMGVDRKNPGQWYCYTNLHFMARMLETMGLIPQDLSEYEEQEATQ